MQFPKIKNLTALAISLALLILVGSPAAMAQTDDAKNKNVDSKTTRSGGMDHFLRIKRDRRGRPLAMQTSVTRYELKNEDGETVTVDLIGVVHVGEEKYYQDLNDIFEQYDGMLFELVAPEGTVIPKGGREPDGAGLNPIAAMQKGMQQGLGLEFQLDHIDYTKDNFVHADMSPEEFAESMTANGESVWKIMGKAVGQSMAMQGSGSGGSEIRMLMAMFSDNREMRLRRIAAEQMKQMEAGMAIFEGENGSTIIDHRNGKAMDVLKREMARGKKKLALFYGAGHLPDMQRRLTSEFQMKRAGQFWLDAWLLR